MKKICCFNKMIIFLLLGLASHVSAQQSLTEIFQNKSELYFQFMVEDVTEIQNLSSIISIDRVDGNLVTAVASPIEFESFLKYGYQYQVIPSPNEGFEARMLDFIDTKQMDDWDFYPTYGAFETMMYQFQTDYPDLCTIQNIGTLISGRKLLGARVTSNVVSPGLKPQFLYSATMHGDETAGYILSLRLIHTLLSQYSSNASLARLVDSVEIWIFPLANPDGTYKGGNNTVNGAVRYNANNIDLNRNYHDPVAGPHPDGNAWQPETLAFMTFAAENHFTMGANMHGGAEVCNYPWDTWAQLPPDDAWWNYVCREYADTAQFYSPSNYFTYLTGVTNGAAWYMITGGRQDYMNYFHYCREFTLEMSNTKLLPTSQLNPHWNYNYRSLLNYLEQSLYGVRGVITDVVTGQPVYAKVFIEGHDLKNSHVFSHPQYGSYFRYLSPGTYTLTFSAPCYESVSQNVTVTNRHTTWKDLQMTPLALQAQFSASQTSIDVGGSVQFSDVSCGNVSEWQWTFEGGTPSTSTQQNPLVYYNSQGAFNVSLTISDGTNSHTTTLENYIKVGLMFIMSNGTVTTCLGDFYDSGGSTGNYANNENYVLTFLPSSVGAKVKVNFLQFDVEANATCNYDWLKIFNGTGISSPLIGTYCGTTSPGTITATNAEGALTFQFKSDNSINKPGWTAEVLCNFPGVAPVADFYADKTKIVQGDTIHFTDNSAGIPTSWQWTFPGGTPASSTLQNPQIKYSTPGFYAVTLTAVNQFGNNTLVKENYIEVEEGVGGVSNHNHQHINLFPNPVRSGSLSVKSDKALGNVIILNAIGQTIIKQYAERELLQIDVSNFDPGLYIVVLINNHGISSRKFQVQ